MQLSFAEREQLYAIVEKYDQNPEVQRMREFIQHGDVTTYQHCKNVVVVSFWLNDSCSGLEKLGDYTAALRSIFRRLRQEGVPAILMTPNMMCSYVDCRVQDDLERSVAEGVVRVQNDGILDAYMEAARTVAAEEGARVCDCYAAWKTMAAAGVDTTFLLANHINHPSRELHWLFAWKLAQTIFAG